jgi:hypothetical protein
MHSHGAQGKFLVSCAKLKECLRFNALTTGSRMLSELNAQLSTNNSQPLTALSERQICFHFIIETRSLPALARSYPCHFTLIARTSQCLRQLPSCVAVYPRGSQSRRVLCPDPISSLKLSRYPRFFTATLAALPSISEIPFLDCKATSVQHLSR